MKVFIDRQTLWGILSFAQDIHPNEVVLLLRGKRKKDAIFIEEFLFPPFASSGRGFAQFPPHMLPIDFSILGTAHSHPSGSAKPSTIDVNRFYGRIMMIVAYPYREESVIVYNSKGESLPIIIN